MIKRSHGYFTPAFVQGLFFAILYKTGFDISASGLTVMIVNAFEPIMSEQLAIHLPVIAYLSHFILLLSLVGVLWHHGIKGLIVYIVIIVASFVLFISMLQ